jgi:hypothetical protein
LLLKMSKEIDNLELEAEKVASKTTEEGELR